MNSFWVLIYVAMTFPPIGPFTSEAECIAMRTQIVAARISHYPIGESMRKEAEHQTRFFICTKV